MMHGYFFSLYLHIDRGQYGHKRLKCGNVGDVWKKQTNKQRQTKNLHHKAKFTLKVFCYSTKIANNQKQTSGVYI